MLFEKKMVILTGVGKGVVLIERNGLGVKFALRTFGVEARGGSKMGVVLPDRVVVRELPARRDPDTVFFTDDTPLTELHIAVFDDSRLLLYGSIGKPMWEANILGILRSHCAKQAAPVPLPVAPLAPIANKPKTLPLPDGTGIPQSHAYIYGDEQLATDNFYTTLDMSSRMREVDSFLDSPRVLDGLSPRIEQKQEVGFSVGVDPETSGAPPRASEICATRTEKTDKIEPKSDDMGNEPIPSQSASQSVQSFETEEAAGEENENDAITENTVTDENENNMTVEEEVGQIDNYETANNGDGEEYGQVIGEAESIVENNATGRASDNIENNMTEADMTEAAAVASASEERTEVKEMPWEMTARWLTGRASRKTVERTESVSAVPNKTEIKSVRVTSFFERSRGDVDKLFAQASRDGELAALLPDLEWIKVPVEGHTISVGRGGNTFLCYAVAGEYEKTSPLGEEAQWLPKLKTSPTGKGYWLIFQNLDTGEIISG